MLNKLFFFLFICFSLNINAQDYTQFKSKLGLLESSNNYKVVEVNKSGRFLGKYQFGYLALEDLKLVKDGVWVEYSEKEFLNSPNLQEKTVDSWISLLNKRLDTYKLKKYIGIEIMGVKVSLAGLLAASHLGGIRGVKMLLENGYNPKDRFGTSLLDYMKKFESVKI